jgi:hypothetical protein
MEPVSGPTLNPSGTISNRPLGVLVGLFSFLLAYSQAGSTQDQVRSHLEKEVPHVKIRTGRGVGQELQLSITCPKHGKWWFHAAEMYTLGQVGWNRSGESGSEPQDT